MPEAAKACPVVVRRHAGRHEILAFEHPSAGKQFVKGSVKVGEHPRDAARRELREESGLDANSELIFLGTQLIGKGRQTWHFFEWYASNLPDAWSHQSEDDFGHTFKFFWHPVDEPLGDAWHATFREAFDFFAPLVSRQ